MKIFVHALFRSLLLAALMCPSFVANRLSVGQLENFDFSPPTPPLNNLKTNSNNNFQLYQITDNKHYTT